MSRKDVRNPGASLPHETSGRTETIFVFSSLECYFFFRRLQSGRTETGSLLTAVEWFVSDFGVEDPRGIATSAFAEKLPHFARPRAPIKERWDLDSQAKTKEALGRKIHLT